MLVRMSKLEIVGNKEVLPNVLRQIHELGCLHIEDVIDQAEVGRYVVRPMVLDENKLREKRDVEEAVVRVGAIISSLPRSNVAVDLLNKQKEAADKAWKEETPAFLLEVKETLDSVEDQARSLSKEKRDLLAEQANLVRYQAVMTKVAPLAGRLVALENYDSMALLVEKKFADLIEIVRKEVDRVTQGQSHIVADDIDERTIAVLVVFHNKFSRQIRSFLSGESVNEVVVPEDLRSLTYNEALVKVESRRSEIPGRLSEVDRELNTLSRHWYATLVMQRQALKEKLAELDIVGEFGATDYTFVIIGWMPSKHVKRCKQDFEQVFGEDVIVQELSVTEHEAERAPIEYIHSALVKPFESIVEMFGTPKYGSVDPVPLVAIFFPLFFGIILGDMGYALVLLGIAAYLRFKQRANAVLQAIATILLLSGGSSLFFGFVYGEFFGTFGKGIAIKLGAPEMVKILGIPFPWDREKLLIPTLLLAVGLGAAHILLGLVLGMVNGYRAHSRKHVMEKAATIVALIGLAPIIWGMMGKMPYPLATPGWVLLIASIPVLIYSAGIMGPIEVLGALSNIVSYARIMAIGLVSVILAKTANDLGGSVGETSIFLGVFIAVLIHALNLAIHVFTPSLHVLRLNFVEFFGKFYEPGGKPYKPFKRGGEA